MADSPRSDSPRSDSPRSDSPRSDPLRFDTIVIGAGQAGPGIAAKLASDGERVALIEAERFGGTCLNTGCRPTKAMRASARAAHVARSSAVLGVSTSTVTVDFGVVMGRIHRLIDGWRSSSLAFFEHAEHLSYLAGHARFVGGDLASGYRVVVERTASDAAAADTADTADAADSVDGREVLVASRVVLNTGARSVPPSVDGLDTVDWLDHRSILELEQLPSSLVVLGGSYIGLEFAQIFARLGSDVTVIEPSGSIIGREDPEISASIASMLQAEGITIELGAAATRVRPFGDGGVVVELAGGREVTAAAMLVATGRRPNTEELGLDTVGVDLDEHGYVVIDDVFRTTAAGVYAVGDVNGHGAFTHTSYQDHEILVDHLRGGSRSLVGRRQTYALFTDPPLGRVGMSEREAIAAGHRVRTSTMDAADITLAALEAETTGLVKLVVDDSSGELLGVAAFCEHGDELVSTFSAFMHAGSTLQQMAEWLPIHPTVSEFVPTFVGPLLGR